MGTKVLILTGIEGYCEGTLFRVEEGTVKVFGRSRSCDISLRKLRKWLDAPEQEKEDAIEFKSISRRHCKVELVKGDDGYIGRFTDLSRNGTFVDEDKVGSVSEVTDWNESHYLRLGDREKFSVELMDDDENAPKEEEVIDFDDDEEEEEAEEAEEAGDGNDAEGETGKEEKKKNK